jgi:hypothetical protein
MSERTRHGSKRKKLTGLGREFCVLEATGKQPSYGAKGGFQRGDCLDISEEKSFVAGEGRGHGRTWASSARPQNTLAGRRLQFTRDSRAPDKLAGRFHVLSSSSSFLLALYPMSATPLQHKHCWSVSQHLRRERGRYMWYSIGEPSYACLVNASLEARHRGRRAPLTVGWPAPIMIALPIVPFSCHHQSHLAPPLRRSEGA